MRIKIKKQKRKNKNDIITDKKVELYLNRDFQKWTNSFARKSVLWVDEKDALISDVVKQRASSRSKGRRQSESRERMADRCCGASPGKYGH